MLFLMMSLTQGGWDVWTPLVRENRSHILGRKAVGCDVNLRDMVGGWMEGDNIESDDWKGRLFGVRWKPDARETPANLQEWFELKLLAIAWAGHLLWTNWWLSQFPSEIFHLVTDGNRCIDPDPSIRLSWGSSVEEREERLQEPERFMYFLKCNNTEKNSKYHFLWIIDSMTYLRLWVFIKIIIISPVRWISWEMYWSLIPWTNMLKGLWL